MANEVVMPRLGWTMEVGRVVEWLKQDGDLVEAGDLLFLVETEKAVSEVEALDSGILRRPPDAPAVGEDVEVGGRLAWIVPAGEAVPGAERGPEPAGAGRTVEREPSPAAVPDAVPLPEPVAMPAPPAVVRAARPAISPRARRAAAAIGIDWIHIDGTGSGGRIVERDVLNAPR